MAGSSMTQRFLLYPLIFAAAFQFLPLLRSQARWYGAQISQSLALLLVSLAGLYFSNQIGWVIVAWGLFVGFVTVPKFLVRLAMQRQMMHPVSNAIWAWRMAAWFSRGQIGRLYRTYATALKLWSDGDFSAARELLEQFAAQPLPREIHGEIAMFELSLLIAGRQFEAAVEFYELVYDWCTLSSLTLARLLAARAYAETGDMQHALRCLHFVALSPRTFGPLESQLWATRVAVAALAGDVEELERLLKVRDHRSRIHRRNAACFAAYWRGRCDLARGERAEAVKYLTRAYALTRPRNKAWRDAIMQYLQQAEALSMPISSPTPIAARMPDYTVAQQGLRYSEQQTAGWRGLMSMGWPAPVTMTLLLVFLIVFLADVFVFSGHMNRPLWEWAGNIPEAVRHGDWWRPVTALFLHANWLHLGMNGLALCLFGSAVEKTMGRWRFFVIFIVAGSLGNFISAWWAHYDVSIGASGGVFGVIGAFGVAAYHLDVPIYSDVRKRLILLVALMVAADLTISGLEPQVDNFAHAGGLVVGMVLALLLRPSSGRTRQQG